VTQVLGAGQRFLPELGAQSSRAACTGAARAAITAGRSPSGTWSNMRAMRGGPPASDLVGRLPPPREHDGAPAGHRYLRPPAGLRRDPSGWSPSGACPGSPGGGRPARRAGGPNVTAAARAARMRSGPHSRPPRQASRCLRRSQTSADQLDCGALAGLAGRMGAGQRTGAHALESRRPPPKRSVVASATSVHSRRPSLSCTDRPWRSARHRQLRGTPRHCRRRRRACPRQCRACRSRTAVVGPARPRAASTCRHGAELSEGGRAWG
jgi:hypothetical protein